MEVKVGCRFFFCAQGEGKGGGGVGGKFRFGGGDAIVTVAYRCRLVYSDSTPCHKSLGLSCRSSLNRNRACVFCVHVTSD